LIGCALERTPDGAHSVFAEASQPPLSTGTVFTFRRRDWGYNMVTSALGLTMRHMKFVLTTTFGRHTENVVHFAGRVRIGAVILNGYVMITRGQDDVIRAPARFGLQWWAGRNTKCFIGRLQDRFVLSAKTKLANRTRIRPTLLLASEWSRVGLRYSLVYP
jgi:hypothetical protein